MELRIIFLLLISGASVFGRTIQDMQTSNFDLEHLKETDDDDNIDKRARDFITSSDADKNLSNENEERNKRCRFYPNSDSDCSSESFFDEKSNCCIVIIQNIQPPPNPPPTTPRKK
ncbi:uncharacterized protein LOC105192475 [Harpegnathos saltator]|uniref:uncharacterized protein LOC105192475 n=1 Tax=Harpegnathos saltator TaxID=610380 RepID=UPI00059036CB|nr:uncharacterized protein LOC105192475 [Harpegnathos saltator]